MISVIESQRIQLGHEGITGVHSYIHTERHAKLQYEIRE